MYKMQIVMQIAIIALMSTFVYALIALGFTLVFGILRVVNFAHGEFYMLGAYAMYVFYDLLAWSYLPSIVAAGLLVGVLGLLAERGLFKRFAGDEMGGMIMSLALAITLQASMTLLFSVDEQSLRRPVEGAWQIGQAFFAKDQLLVVAISVFALAGFYFLIERTRLGLTIRAVAQDREVALLQGVSSWKIMAFTFALSCGLAGLAGALMAPVYTVHPYMGEAVVVKAFIIVVLGGLGSLPGAVVAAFILSVTEAVASTFYNATVAHMVSFLIVMVVLLVRPSGLMGKST